MYCQRCNAQLSTGAKVCANCGTLVPAYYAGSSSDEPTLRVTPESSVETIGTPPPPSDQYDSGPSSAPNPYSISNPYEVPSLNSYDPSLYPLPSSPQRSTHKRSPVLLVLLTVLIIAATVGFIFLKNNQFGKTLSSITTTRPVGNTGSPFANATPTASTDRNPASTDRNPTTTAAAFYTLYDTDTSRLPTQDDPLRDNTNSLQWDQGQGCTFMGGALHIRNEQSSGSYACMAHRSNFSNFLCQVQMTIINGSYGSLIFRSDAALSNFYIFREGEDGVFTVALYKGGVDTEIYHSPNLVFKQGPNQTNLLAVIAQGSHLIFYINAQYVYDTNDSSFSSGEIGLVAGSIGSSTEVAYTNFKLWTL